MNSSLKINIVHKQKINLSLRHSLELFQLSSHDLQNYINEQIEANPVIKIPDSNYSSDYHFYEMAEKISIYHFLINQVIGWKEEKQAIHLIHLLDQDGYFRENEKEIQKKIGIKTYQTLIKKLQQLEPTGVFSRNLKECYMLQLKELKQWNKNWDKFLSIMINNYGDLTIFFSQEEIRKKINYLKRLAVAPGDFFHTDDSELISPDIYAVYIDGQWICHLNPSNNPTIEIDADYKIWQQHIKKPEEKKQIKDSVQNAKWLSNTLIRRAEMLKKTTLFILNYQSDFFLYNNKKLKPLKLKDIALELYVHESTISRIIRHKFVHTKQGIFSLNFFLKTGVSSDLHSWNSEKLSSYTIQKHIDSILKTEPHHKPYSDSCIEKILQSKGIMVARRTIAKYRKINNIPPTFKRKNYYLLKKCL